MRILVSNPDTLGDLVLRQPMYHALGEAGHELLLVVRRGVEPLVRYVAPSARTLVLPGEVYSNDLVERRGEFEETFRAARDFNPDALVVAPYRWTLFEELLAEALPEGVRRVGMSGHLYAGDPHAGPAPESRLRFDVVADVCEDEAEVAKNAGLCAAVLGNPPPLIDPQLRARGDALEAARGTLHGLGLEPGGYWVACVGGTAHVSIKTWPPEHWGRVLGECARRYGRKFLFVGLPEELPAAQDVRRAMAQTLGEEAAAKHSAMWLEPSSTVNDLLALTELSAGYVGHDTGPMHVAAAMGKPTVGVFGGGTWPRFRPAVDPSVALLVGVPCAGCGWACSFSTSHCIKQVPVYEVMTALIDMEEGRVKQRETRVLRPSRELQDQMIEEAAAYVRQQVREKATLAVRLREVEGEGPMRGTEALEAVRAELESARNEARHAGEAAERRAAETEQLRHDLEVRAAESQRLSATLEAQTLEVNRLRDEIRGILRDVERAGGNGVHRPEQVLPPGQTAAPGPAPAAEPPHEPREDEIERLRAAVERLDTRVRELEAPPRPVRRPLRQVIVERVIGSKYYPRRPQPPMPRVTVVTPVLNEAAAVRATVESVLGQTYPHVEYVVVDLGSTDGTVDMLREYEDRIDRVVSMPGAGPMEAVAQAFERAQGDVLTFLLPGDVLEVGGLARVGEYFAGHRGVSVVYFEDAVLYDGGWKFPPPRQPTADVYHLLRLARQGRRFTNGVFFRRAGYLALGPMEPKFGPAADWELFARLARRFELRRLGGHVRSVRASGSDPAYAASLAAAREAFERDFGAAGRIRCRLLQLGHRAFDGLRRAFPSRFDFPFEAGESDGVRVNLPEGDAPAAVPGQPINPLADRPSDWLLFSTQDTTGGDRAVHHVYYDSSTGVALAAPPLPRERLAAMYGAREARAAQVTPPAEGRRSPYAGFARGLLGRLLQRLPSPWWWFEEPDFSDVTGDEAFRVLRGLLDPNDANVRLLNVGCFDGMALDRVKARARWQLCGTETNGRAAAAARAKGYRVWEVAPQDAALELPVDERFDVVLMTNMVEHLANPLLILRRLRQLLKPGGLVVLNQPNLDSAHVEFFGPTWGQWQVPYHRVLMGRRGLRKMAELADMRVVRLRTRTLPYPACVSVRLNELGLGAVVPDTARFGNEVASRGVRLTGWSRLLWDWRGRGDFMFAVLRSL